MRLVLASQSPRRAELLSAAGYAFEVQAADVDERVPISGLEFGIRVMDRFARSS